MATISNYYDLLLQATTPRLTVTAVTILPGNSGFLKPKNTLSLAPASILLNTTIVGFTAPAYSWYYAVSTAPTTFILIGSAVSSSYTLSNTTFLTHVGSGNSVIYKCKVTQAGWADAESITTITYTKQNNDVPVATLNKTSILLPTTEADVVNYANSDSKITVSIGGVNIPYDGSVTPAANTFNISTTTSGITAGTPGIATSTITNDTRTFGNVSLMSAGTAPASINYTITARDIDGVATTFVLTQTVTKAVSGNSGYTINVSGGTRAVTYDASSANPTPASSQFTVAIQQNGSSITPVSYSWSATGIYSGTSTASTFTPTLASAYSSAATSVSVSIVPATGYTPVVTTIPISVTKIGNTGNQTATAYIYQWATAQPSTPTGSSTYTWATGANSAYTTADGWSTTVPNNPGSPGIYLWFATKSVVASGTTTTSTINWTTGATVAASTGNGLTGQKTARPSVYQWAASIPTISGTNIYTWSSGTLNAAPSGWSLAPPSSTVGFTLWQATVPISDAATATTSTVNWSSASILASGYAGSNGGPGQPGASARVMYARIANNPQPTAGTVTVSGDNRPTGAQASGTWNANFNVTWYASDPDPASVNSLYQADGVYDGTNTAWSAPYISSLKVGALQAVSTNTGTLTVTGDITVSATGNIKGGQTGYDSGIGFFLGHDSAVPVGYKFSIGSSATKMTWNGTNLSVIGGTITGSIFQTASSGARIVIDSATNSIKGYDSISSALRTEIYPDFGFIKITNLGSTQAIYGEANSGNGVVGRSQGGSGVSGSCTTGYGISGYTTQAGAGVFGQANTTANGVGVQGSATSTGSDAFAATSSSGYGLKVTPNATKASVALGLHGAKPTTSAAGDIAVISIAGGGNYLAWYDGSNWYRVATAALV